MKFLGCSRYAPRLRPEEGRDAGVDVFELQDRVTQSVVGAIAPKIDQAEIERAKRNPVENLDAYDCYLRGMAKAHVQTLEAWEEALLLFYRAIELDPNFATPYAMAARAYAARRQNGKVIDKDWEEAETRRLAMCVSVMDRDDALALCWAGQTLAYMCGDCATGAAMVDQGLAINPNLAVGWQLRALISSWLGQHELAMEQIARASRLNPKDPEAFRSENVMAVSLVLLGQYDEAIIWVTKSLAHLPNFSPAMRVSAVANALAGNLDEARRAMAGVRRAEPKLRMANLRNFLPPYRRPQDVERLIEGARLAGLPE
jgi:tetratricopeptide (TPR) repeat protein